MVIKEFRQLRRDRRTLAMLIVMPLVLLIVFGYAASFDVPEVRTVGGGPDAEQAARGLPGRPRGGGGGARRGGGGGRGGAAGRAGGRGRPVRRPGRGAGVQRARGRPGRRPGRPVGAA